MYQVTNLLRQLNRSVRSKASLAEIVLERHWTLIRNVVRKVKAPSMRELRVCRHAAACSNGNVRSPSLIK